MNPQTIKGALLELAAAIFERLLVVALLEVPAAGHGVAAACRGLLLNIRAVRLLPGYVRHGAAGDRANDGGPQARPAEGRDVPKPAFGGKRTYRRAA